jgi:hypothetical protein
MIQKKLLPALFCIICLTQLCNSQWNPEVQLTTNPNGVETTQKIVAARGNYVHVVWTDFRHPETEIYYKRSTNSGATWEAETRFTNQAGISYGPQICVYQSNVYVVWYDYRDGNMEIYFKRSADDGTTWDPVVRLTNSLAASLYPAISNAGEKLYVTFTDSRSGNDKIYLKSSTDGGVTWGSDVQLSAGALNSRYSSTDSYANSVYVTWIDTRFGNSEIFFKRSTDNGNNWGPETRLTNNSASSDISSVNATGQFVSVFWQDDRDGHPEIYFKRSTDQGLTWTVDARMTNGNYEARNMSSTATGNNIHFVWEEVINFSKEIFYNRSTDGGITWTGRTYVTPQGGSDYGYNPSIAFTGTTVHTVWRDTRNSNANMLYYRQNPNNGNPTSITNNNSELPKEFSLSQNYPNPFNPNTNIGFRIADFGFVSLKVYDVIGKEVAALVNEKLNAGVYNINFDASGLASGMYFYKLTSGEFVDTKKLILVK